MDILYQYLILWVGEEEESYHVEVLWKVFREKCFCWLVVSWVVCSGINAATLHTLASDSHLHLEWFGSAMVFVTLARLCAYFGHLRLSKTVVDSCVWASLVSELRHSHWKHLFSQQKFHVKPQCFSWLVAVLFFMCYQWLLVYHNHLKWQFLLNLVFVFPLYLLFILYAFSSSKASLVLPERQNWSRIWCYLVIKVDW